MLLENFYFLKTKPDIFCRNGSSFFNVFKKKFFFLLQPSCPNGYICHHGHCDIGMSYLIFLHLDISYINIYLFN